MKAALKRIDSNLKVLTQNFAQPGLAALVKQAETAAGQAEVESVSEALLSVFEQLSATYESSMQVLMG